MNLVPVVKSKAAGGHEGHHKHGHSMKEAGGHQDMQAHDHHGGGHAHRAGMIDDFKRRFYAVLVLIVPIMALSPMIQHGLRVDWSFTGSNYILLLLSSLWHRSSSWFRMPKTRNRKRNCLPTRLQSG